MILPAASQGNSADDLALQQVRTQNEAFSGGWSGFPNGDGVVVIQKDTETAVRPEQPAPQKVEPRLSVRSPGFGGHGFFSSERAAPQSPSAFAPSAFAPSAPTPSLPSPSPGAIRLKRPRPLKTSPEASDSQVESSAGLMLNNFPETLQTAPEPQIIPGRKDPSPESARSAAAEFPPASAATMVVPSTQHSIVAEVGKASSDVQSAEQWTESRAASETEMTPVKEVSSELSVPVEESEPQRYSPSSPSADVGNAENSEPVNSVIEENSSGVPRELTMLDRLRELYTPRREENTSDVIRKQLRRLQTPWGLLRDREPILPELPSQTVDASVMATPSPEFSEFPAADPVDDTRGLDLLIAELEQELSIWPRDAHGKPEQMSLWRRRQTDLRLLYLIADRSSDATGAIELLPTDEQEFWQAMMLAMAYYRGLHSDEEREEQLASTADQLRSAIRHVSALSPLQIRRMAFCSEINSFGNVDTFPTADFHPGQPVLIYAEVQNFRFERTADGSWRSKFSAVLEICRNDEIQPIESIRIEEISDESTSPRTDYFQSYELTVPQLAKGMYTVRLNLRDRISQQQTTSSLEFNIR